MSNLSERAMLTYLRICRWNGSRQNADVAAELCRDKGAEDDAATVVINYVPREKLRTLKKKASRVHHVWTKWSRPWMDGGTRIISNHNLSLFRKELDEAIAAYDAEAQRWIAEEYPTILEQMPARLASLLDGRQMPTASELLSRFRIVSRMFPVPSQKALEDFRLEGEGSEEVKKQMLADLNQGLKEQTFAAMTEVWDEFRTLVGRVQDRLSDPENKFKDSLIENLRAFCERLPSDNFSDDPRLEQIRQEVIKSLDVDPQDLRDNPMFRKGIAKKAAVIAEKITTTAKARKINLDL